MDGGMNRLKRLARIMIPPRLLTFIVAARARRHSHRLNAGWGVRDLSGKLLDLFDATVQGGPFAGLKLPREAAAEHLGPYLLGTYERELHAFWRRLAAGSIPLVVNVGAKFGYYAAGLSRLLDAPVRAFDADPWARRLLARTAELNGAAIEIRGGCTRRDLEVLPPGSLVVMDCDGCEEVLLQPPLPEGLRRSRLVIELHGPALEGDETVKSLARTHDVEVVPSQEGQPPPADLPSLTAHERELATLEIRTPQRWLLCTPRG